MITNAELSSKFKTLLKGNEGAKANIPTLNNEVQDIDKRLEASQLSVGGRLDTLE